MNEADIKAYGQSWYAATKVDDPLRPRLSVDLDVDACVIGGGLAGLTAARELAKSGWSVVLLEANRIASGASGRNTGFVLPGFAADADKLVGRVGFERTRSLWALSQAGVDYVRDTIAAEGAAGIDPQDGWLYVSKIDNGDEVVRNVRLLGDLGCEIEGWPTDRVRAVLHSERYFHAIHYLKALAIHPLNYALLLAAAAERDGARIFENTPVLSIDPQGVRKRIVTPSARLRANHVVIAGNVQIGGLIPRIAATLIPITPYVITTAPLGAQLAEAIHFHGAVSDTDRSDNHYRVVGGDRLMLSGRATTWARNPRRYIRALTRDIRKTYPQLKDIDVDYAWRGTLGNTVHRMPQIGELGAGVWLASGFGGHGLNTTAMAGNLIARAIVSNDQTWREFSAFELVWAGGIAGRIGVQIRNWVRRYRDAMNERRAKARELADIAAHEAERKRQAEEVARQKAEAAAAERRAAEAEEARRLAAIEAERHAAEAEEARLAAEEEARRIAAKQEARQRAAEEEARQRAAEEEARLAAEEEARQRAAEEDARQLAADEEVQRAAEAEAARLAPPAEADIPLQSGPPPGDVAPPAVAMETPRDMEAARDLETSRADGALITPAEVTPEPEQPVRNPPTKRRTKNRRRRERPQDDRRKSEITQD
jgi:gamma-glutamylputrescine oxidase